MAGPEYIRTHSEPSSSALLSVPCSSGTAFLTFLHAGRSRWNEDDKGPTAPTENGHSHPVYHIVLYTSGTNTMIHNGRITDFKRGSMVLANPGSIHEYRPRGPGGGSFMEITFDLRVNHEAVTLGWNEILSLWTGRVVRSIPDTMSLTFPILERLEWILDEIINHLTSSDSFSQESAGIAMGRFVVELVRYLNSERGSDRTDHVDRLELARNMLEKKYSSRLSISELAEIACLSEGAFIRGFSRRYGMPPMTYRKRLRITAAQHLLSVSGRTVGEIATNVGYGDIYTFSRTFKAVTGMTASQWRKSNRSNS